MTFGIDRERTCCGWGIQYCNNLGEDRWVVMHWGEFMAGHRPDEVFTLTDACEWLRDRLSLEE